jgi:outer membrane lipoprotein-sorting protein
VLDGDDTVDGAACWKITSTPRASKSSQYTRSIVWVRKDNYAFARFENYVKDQVVRRLNYSNFQNVQGIWTAKQLEMTDVRRGSRTRLTLDKLEYNVPLKDADFTLQAIRRQ